MDRATVMQETPKQPRRDYETVMDLDKFAETRPYLWHLTDAGNVERIRRMKQLECAATLLCAGGCTACIGKRRKSSCIVRVDGDDVRIRDQKPLHDGNMQLPEGWSFEKFVKFLNSHVFFWPGTAQTPKGSGKGHFRRYVNECPTGSVAVLRVPTKDLFAANCASPLFSRYNSGSPRRNRGTRIPRGPNTFVCGNTFPLPPSKVIEVVFRKSAVLLPTICLAILHPDGPDGWRLDWCDERNS